MIYSCTISKEMRSMKRKVTGDWVLQTITTEGEMGAITKSTLFNEAEFGCFIGSAWNFNKKNNQGGYTIVDTKKECPEIKRSVQWIIEEPANAPKQFQLKRLDESKNFMNDPEDLNFTIAQLDDKEMKWRKDFMLAGKPVAIVYNFIKK